VTFSATLHVSPRGKGRPRFGKGRTFTDAKTVAAEAEIRWLLQKEKPPCLAGPVCLVVRFFLLRPKSAKKRPYPDVRSDLDNYLKMLLDACNKILWNDDAQVCHVTASKSYCLTERIEIEVGELV